METLKIILPPIKEEGPKVFKVIAGSCFPLVKYEGTIEKDARKIFSAYVLKSSFGHGEMGHEPILLLCGENEIERYVWKLGDKPNE